MLLLANGSFDIKIGKSVDQMVPIKYPILLLKNAFFAFPIISRIKHFIFLRLRETHNALQLPVFFFFLFFCKRYPEYRGIRSKKLFYS